MRKQREIEFEIVARPGPVRIDDAKVGAVHDEGPSLVGADRIADGFAPRRVEWLAPAGHRDWNMASAAPKSLHAGGIASVNPPAHGESENLQERKCNSVGDRANAGRGTERGITARGPLLERANGIWRSNTIARDGRELGVGK